MAVITEPEITPDSAHAHKNQNLPYDMVCRQGILGPCRPLDLHGNVFHSVLYFCHKIKNADSKDHCRFMSAIFSMSYFGNLKKNHNLKNIDCYAM